MTRFLAITLFILYSITTKAQKPVSVSSFGLNHRIYPIDIENVRLGALPQPKGLPSYNQQFWNTLSVYGQFGYLLKKNWLVSGTAFFRYNLLNRTSNIRYSIPAKIKRKNNFKSDLFVDIEKKLKLSNKKEIFFLVTAGTGFTNINSKFDVTLVDTTETGTYEAIRYSGTMLHFGPRFGLGFQYKSFKLSLNSFIIEDPNLTNLTSLWIGGSIGYELVIKRKKQSAR